ncbi:MAG: hypothetical protein JO011_01770 [Ktedonobacteraceae bacterium]|nr:hypothetical protein [Ktedonobacteraceae bacterium]
MLSPDDTTHTTQVTESLERLPRPSDRRSPAHERRRSALQQKNTDSLPSVTFDTPHAKIAWRQVIQLREENRHLRFQLEEQRTEMQQLIAEYNALQTQFDQEATGIHSNYQQERDHYQSHLQALMDERNRLQEAYTNLERRYMDLYHTFQDAVEEEAHKMVTEAAQTIELSPDNAPMLFQDVMKTLELQVRQEEDKHLVEALYLKREVQRMAALLEQERQQIEEERRTLLGMQNTAREQAELRQKTLQARLRFRWKLRSVTVTIGMIILLVTLQFLFLNLAHIKIASEISFFLLLTIIICSLLAFGLSGPFSRARDIYYGAPHKKKVKKD